MQMDKSNSASLPYCVCACVRACMCLLWSAVATSLLATSKTLVSSPVALEMKAFCWRSNEECACTYAHAPPSPLSLWWGKLKLTFKYAISVCGRRKCPRCTVKRSLSALFCWAPNEARSSVRRGKSNTSTGLLSLFAATLTMRSYTVFGMTSNNLGNVIRRDTWPAHNTGAVRNAPRYLPACLPACLGRLQNVFLRTRTGQRTQAHERQAAVCRCSCCMLLKVFPSFPSLPSPPFPSAAPGGCVSSSVAKTKADRCCWQSSHYSQRIQEGKN